MSIPAAATEAPLALALVFAGFIAGRPTVANAKGGSNITVTTTGSVSGTVVSGVITIANAGSGAVAVSAISESLEVRFPSDYTPPPLPAGQTSGWYRVAQVSVPSPGSVPGYGSVTVPYSINVCAGGVAAYPGAKDMRSTARVTAGSTFGARSVNYPLPGKCPVCGNYVQEAGEQCDLGPSGGPCCATNCQYRATGTSCSDGNACTQTDQCQAGACVGSNPRSCAASDQCHDAGVCIPATGLCTNPNRANGTPCDDGSACTQTDSCLSGICRGANPVVCTAPNACQTASCDPTSGLCSTAAKPDGTACSIGDACTVDDACLAGECAASADRDCNDHLSCTSDTCDSIAGCGHEPTPVCGPCDAGECTACGDACVTENAACTEGCWAGFWSCVSGCTSTYCAPFCQVDLGYCLDACPAIDACKATCDSGNGCAAGCTEPQ